MSTSAPLVFPAIPPFTGSGVLPPFVGGDPTKPALVSPYTTTLVEFVERFSFSPERRAILDGFLRYRSELLAAGLTGFQWLDGSFLEQIEVAELRPPRDLDCVSFTRRPPHCTNDTAAWNDFVRKNLSLFDPSATKHRYSVDAYFIDLDIATEEVAKRTAYWFGLFSHRRTTSLWKGMLQVALQSTADDKDALALLRTK